MKIILQDNNQFVLRFDKNEQVFELLGKFMTEQKIGACSFTGLGSSLSMELGFYNSHLKDYRKKPYVEEMEVVSLTGNGSLKDGQPVIHAHGIFGRNDFTLLGGHVFSVVASATCEIHLTKLNGEMKREPNADFNLNLLS